MMVIISDGLELIKSGIVDKFIPLSTYWYPTTQNKTSSRVMYN